MQTEQESTISPTAAPVALHDFQYAAVVMKELIEQWLTKQRKRVELGKLKPASLDTFRSRTTAWILPHLGDLDIESVRNGKVKEFAEALVAAGNGPKTTREIVALVKQILDSHVNEDGEPILELKWRTNFIFENVKKIGKQKQPTITKDALNAVFKNRSLKVRDRVLIALAASTGMRVGELLATKLGGASADNTTWSPEAAVIHVRKSIYRGQIQDPKTISAIRDIDLSTPLQNMLTEFAKGRQSGEFLFSTKSGKPLEQSHVRKFIMIPNGIQGAHACRRYRMTWLEEQGCPKGLRDAWMGHAGVGTASKYDKTAEDLEFRHKQVERIGTGLNLSDVTAPQISKTRHPAASNTKPATPTKRAPTRKDPSASITVKKSLCRRRSQPTDIQSMSAEPAYVASNDDLDPWFDSTPVTVREEV